MITKFKEQYWKYSLVVFILFLGVIIFREFLPFLSGLLGAITMYILVRQQLFFLIEKKKWNTNLAAALILLEVVLCIIAPTFLIIWLTFERLNDVDLRPDTLISTINHFIVMFREKTGYDLVSDDNMNAMTTFVSSAVQAVIGQISSFFINSAVLLFTLYFMLISNRKMENYVYELLPFEEKNKKDVLKKIKVMVTSNAIGIPVLALAQGAIAVVGYYIFGAPNPLLFGFITCFATIIPIVGTSLVWIPLAIYLALTGDWVGAIGLAAYGGLVISNIDNLIRFLVQKKLANTHPLITIFGVIIGLTLFGFWGIIFGPLLLSIFFLLINIFKVEYLNQPTAENTKKAD